MTINPEDYFNAFFSRKEWLTIVETGPGDISGDARVVLSNGDICMWRSPVKGQRAGLLIHRPQIEPLENEAAWLVTPYKEEPVKITAKDLHRGRNNPLGKL